MTFEELGVNQPLRRAIEELGFEHPMPVQEKVIPELLGGDHDVVGLAQTGSGKTAAFGLPVIQRVDPSHNVPQALILAPTRELCLQIAADLSTLTEPFIPFSAAKLRNFLHIDPIPWAKMGDGVLPAGHQLNEPGLLFDKIEDDQIQRQIDRLEATKKANTMANTPVAPAKENITFDDFAKLDIRAGRIVAAEKVAKTKKLLKLTINTGIDTRTVVSGIAEYYTPEEVIGQQVSILVNLAPKELKGIESQGMILMAENADGSLAFVRPDKDIKPGSEIR